jgi:hypothetical protein
MDHISASVAVPLDWTGTPHEQVGNALEAARAHIENHDPDSAYGALAGIEDWNPCRRGYALTGPDANVADLAPLKQFGASLLAEFERSLDQYAIVSGLIVCVLYDAEQAGFAPRPKEQ